MRPDYLGVIGSRDVTAFVRGAKRVFPEFTTLNEGYADKLEAMKESVKRYFEDQTLERPFLYLILGPPGAGKSHLMKKLIEQLAVDTGQTFAFHAVNISEVLDPRELHNFYENIDQNNERGIRTLILFDEVDVRWEQGSAIKQLINPIYDGAYWDGRRFRKFGRCAFFFAGSYLQDRDTLVKTQKLLTGVDLGKFLLDMYLDVRRRGDADALEEVRTALAFCQAQQRWRTDVDPRTDTILYLKNLEKIRDFLSRVAGNVLEMTDVSAPLHVTREAFRIGDGPINASPRLRGVELVRLVKKREQDDGRFAVFNASWEPLLEFKNVLLCERLLRVLGLVERRFRKVFSKGAARFLIDRALLNFLTVAPLINGMRSLEQLISKLDRPTTDDRIQGSIFKQDEMVMIVHSAEEFSDVAQVWYRVARENPRLNQLLSGNGLTERDDVVVPLPLWP